MLGDFKNEVVNVVKEGVFIFTDIVEKSRSIFCAFGENVFKLKVINKIEVTCDNMSVIFINKVSIFGIITEAIKVFSVCVSFRAKVIIIKDGSAKGRCIFKGFLNV